MAKRYQANVAGEYGHSGAGSQGGIIRTLPRSLNCLTSVFLTNAQLGCLTAKSRHDTARGYQGNSAIRRGGISGESRTEAKAASYVKYALPQSFDIQIISGRYPHIMPEQQRKAAKRRIFGAACGGVPNRRMKLRQHQRKFPGRAHSLHCSRDNAPNENAEGDMGCGGAEPRSA